MRTANPALSDRVFNRVRGSEHAMTISGTVNKTAFLLCLLLLAAAYPWNLFFTAQDLSPLSSLLTISLVLNVVLAFATIFKPQWAPITSPFYAITEGLMMGAISATFELRYPGIVIQSVGLTFGTLFSLLIAYRSGLIRATENFKLGVVAATGAVALMYFVSIILGFFHIQVPFLHESTPLGIGVSAVIVVIAALNLVLDFDFIENGAKQGAPKYMEWYGAFGLLVTLVWLYLEILRLLSKTRSRD